MAHDVFISHATEDKVIADAVCATLEQQAIRCWMAPRDIPPGADWGECIVNGIKQARVFVLVFSRRANASSHIPREVERAVSHEIPIIPLRIEEVMPEGSLEYNLATVHWLDALTPPVEAHIRRLSETIRAILGAKSERDRDAPPLPPPAPPARARWLVPALVVAAAVIAIAGYAWKGRERVTPSATPPQVPQTSPAPAPAPAPAPVSRGTNQPASAKQPAATTSVPAAGGTDPALEQLKQRAKDSPQWFICTSTTCSFGALAQFRPAVRRIAIGESSGNLDRTITLPPGTGDPRDRYSLQYIPIRPGSNELYARLEFYDGSKSDVRPARIQSNDRTTGIRLRSDPFMFALLPEPSLFIAFDGRSNRLEIRAEAPLEATAAAYATNGGSFKAARALGSGQQSNKGFEFETDIADADILVRFSMPDGSEAGPFTYHLKDAAGIVLGNFKAGLLADLDKAIACTRVPFALPPVGSLPASERQTVARNTSELRQRGLAFLTKGPAVACVPARQTQQSDLGNYSALQEVRAGEASGKLDQIQRVRLDWKEVLSRRLPQDVSSVWHVVLPASADAVYVQFVFWDGSTSREFRAAIQELSR
jgi:TIR domain-containing protein